LAAACAAAAAGSGLRAEEKVTFEAGKNRYVLKLTLREPGLYEYVATIEVPPGEDGWQKNNTAVNHIYLRGKGKVLVVAGGGAISKRTACAPTVAAGYLIWVLVQGIQAGNTECHHGVAGFVIGGQLPLGLGEHHAPALGAQHHLVLRLLKVIHVDLLVAAPCCQQRGFVHEIGQVRTAHPGRCLGQPLHRNQVACTGQPVGGAVGRVACAED
jgi:hypothetical protein